MSEQCETCKHWGDECDVGWRLRQCHRILRPSVADLFSDGPLPLIAVISDDTLSIVFTQPTFGCPLWAPKEDKKDDQV